MTLKSYIIPEKDYKALKAENKQLKKVAKAFADRNLVLKEEVKLRDEWLAIEAERQQELETKEYFFIGFIILLSALLGFFIYF